MATHKIEFNTAVSIVIANMIGTGVFTSLGFQVMGIQNPAAIIALWLIGGILALCGALTYGEIGSAFPESGGEYNYLSKLYHPAVGFLSGWVSITVGFAAPIAAASVALGSYISKIYTQVNPLYLAIAIIILITIIHSYTLKAGAAFQRVFTLVKIICIVMFVGFGCFHVPNHEISFSVNQNTLSSIFSVSFASSLIYVTYAYSGWNAAAYISGEMIEPKKNLPRALLVGTLVVMIVYTALNAIFLYSVPIDELKGVLEVGYLSANKIFGNHLGQFMSLVIAILLISTISAMILTGPRVMQSMGKNINGLNFFAKTNKNNVPFIAIIFQSAIALILVCTSSFESLINYVGFTLNIFTLLTVFGVFILRKRFKTQNNGYKTFLYPITPLLFIGILLWVLINTFISKTTESIAGLGTVMAGLGIYYLTNRKKVTSKL
ncbi:MAG: amino acid permease [Bacteroidetes bacterium]|mgnify:CR=1 FL=1|nr:amino acid permease [Bacteroidota bacterium]